MLRCLRRGTGVEEERGRGGGGGMGRRGEGW